MMKEAVEDGHHQSGGTAHDLTTLAYRLLLAVITVARCLLACGHQFIENGADLGIHSEIAELN